MPYPRSNSAIALYLLSRFRGLIDSISFKMGARYHLSLEDRRDLVSAAHAKISTTKWRTVLHRGNNRPLENYCISTIQTTMSKELRRIKASGLSGLSKGPTIASFPATFSRDDLGGKPTSSVPLLDRLASAEVAERAQRILSPGEWRVINLVFGFEDAQKTPAEVAKHFDVPVSKVEVILESSLQKLRRVLR